MTIVLVVLAYILGRQHGTTDGINKAQSAFYEGFTRTVLSSKTPQQRR